MITMKMKTRTMMIDYPARALRALRLLLADSAIKVANLSRIGQCFQHGKGVSLVP